jgi:hypothetical protein
MVLAMTYRRKVPTRKEIAITVLYAIIVAFMFV